MSQEGMYESDLRNWLTQFRSEHGYPKQPVSVIDREKGLVAQYETQAGTPGAQSMSRLAAETGLAAATGATAAAGMVMVIGKTLLGGAAARVGVAGAFGAIGVSPLGPAVLVGGTVAAAGYALYKLGKRREENERCQAFGRELLAHMKTFTSPCKPPSHVAIVASPDRRITVLYDPDISA